MRSHDRLFGLPAWAIRELKQLRMGSAFFLQGIQLMAYHLRLHPAPPSDTSRASIWSSPWVELLLQHPEVKLHIAQGVLGAPSPKPTGLLNLRLPCFLRSLYQHADGSLQKPTGVAIGCNPDGSFKTSCLKEYPSRFSAGLAQSITDQLDAERRQGRVRPTSPGSEGEPS